MSQEQYFKDIAEILEVDPGSLSPETDFRKAADSWSSMTGFAMIIYLEDAYGVSVDPDQFSSLNTLGELYSLVAPGVACETGGVEYNLWKRSS